jgi:carbon-monoxide dehydrogenase medium subunit
VIPPPFEYQVAESVEDAVQKLAAGGEDAKALAGGHSLLPLMKMRLAAPDLLVDLRKLDLRSVQRENGAWRIGALTTHAQIASEKSLGLAAEVAGRIADQQVRNRGTIGGSLAHADPAADLPGVLLAVDGSVIVQGPGGPRQVAASDLFVDFLTTSLADDELITEVHLPAMDGYGFASEKFTRRAEDWGMVGVSVLVKQTGGAVEDARIALTNVASVPVRAAAAEQALRGQPLADAVSAAALAAGEGLNPPSDLNATADYKRHLAQVLTKRALLKAVGG